jgi:hypothetical protein
MYRFLSLIVLGGFLLLSLGCGKEDKAIPPKGEIPPMPKGPPVAGEAAGRPGDTAAPVKP